MIEPKSQKLSISRQCKLLGVSRSSRNETHTDDCLRSLIDEQKQISADKVAEMIHSEHKVEAATDISLDEVSLSGYDQLVTMEVAG